jgi:hypothetical protein
LNECCFFIIHNNIFFNGSGGDGSGGDGSGARAAAADLQVAVERLGSRSTSRRSARTPSRRRRFDPDVEAAWPQWDAQVRPQEGGPALVTTALS